MPRTYLIAAAALAVSACATTDLTASEAVDPVQTTIASPISSDPAQIDEAHLPGLAELHFESEGHRLNGLIYLANGPGPHPTVMMLHGYPGNEKNLDLAQSVRRAGYNVLFFHYRGSWGSEGDFGFEHVIEDAGTAAAFLRENAETYRVDPDRIVTIGHSLGGHTSLHTASRDEEISCAAGLAAADFGLVGSVFVASPEAAAGFAGYTDGLVDGPLDGFSGEAAISELEANTERFMLGPLSSSLSGKSVLLVAAERDASVPPATFHTPLIAAYAENPEIDLHHKLLDGDHSFSWTRVALAETVIEWLDGNCR